MPARSLLASATTLVSSCLRSACCRVEICRPASTVSVAQTLEFRTPLARLSVSASTASLRSTTPSLARMHTSATRQTSSSLAGMSLLMSPRSKFRGPVYLDIQNNEELG